MTVKELDELYRGMNVEEMCEAINLDMNDYAEFAWDQTLGRIHPTAAGNLSRIAALIGFRYAKVKQQGRVQ